MSFSKIKTYTYTKGSFKTPVNSQKHPHFIEYNKFGICIHAVHIERFLYFKSDSKNT